MNFEIDIAEEDLINYYKQQWVMEWVKKYHSEIFEQAHQFAEEYVKNDEK